MPIYLVTGCGDLEPEMQDTRTVILKMDFNQKSSSRSSSSVSASELSQYNTHLILALPSREYLTSNYRNYYSSFAQGLMNPQDKKVSLEIPLNTQMKIFAFLFKENYSMSELFSGVREVGYYGESQTFSIGTQTNNLSLGITLIQVPGTGTDTGAATDTTAPTVSSIYPTDNQSDVTITDNISVTFFEAMDNTTVTTNTSNTSCSGSFQLSSNNFSTCVKMSSSPASSNSDKTFTLDPYDNLTVSTTYLTRVTTGVKDTAGNALNSQYETSSGFTTLAPTVLYETTTPTRSGNNIVYSQNNSTSYSDSDLQADGARIGYRMEVTDNNTNYYAETFFDAWDGITLNRLLFPTEANENVIQRTVTNMSVDSNYPTVTNTSSTTGRLEIWPWNYSKGSPRNIGGDNSKYDFDDTHSGNQDYGSMQVHNLSAAQTVMAWNNHGYGVSSPDIGFGNNPANTGNNKHPDWTFSGGSSLGTSNWKFQVLFRYYY